MSDFYGLIGEKLEHSISPNIHELILKELNSKGIYNLFEIKKENLGQAIKGLNALGAKGINVTIPYKVEVMLSLDEISKEARLIGAVNTIDFQGGKLIGYNTDYHGFGQCLKREEVDIYNKSAVILGTGGASKAIVQYLVDNGIKDITYVTRDTSKVSDNIKCFNVIAYKATHDLRNKDIIINCTPCGMHPYIENSPVKKDILSNFSTVVDLIYNPKETLFLKEAKDVGIKAINGLYMLVAQAVAAQEIWHKTKIREEITEQIFQKFNSYFGQ
jgi:shikimate dehydrogenase